VKENYSELRKSRLGVSEVVLLEFHCDRIPLHFFHPQALRYLIVIHSGGRVAQEPKVHALAHYSFVNSMLDAVPCLLGLNEVSCEAKVFHALVGQNWVPQHSPRIGLVRLLDAERLLGMLEAKLRVRDKGGSKVYGLVYLIYLLIGVASIVEDFE